ncbi:MAG: cytochrome-c oxidase, cbb3-type subunit II, partial [Chlamydiia bacterium]|nr:cytochrome-c oxidase, cbb3-type subunit II [Chlamydiia bacterium]
EGFLVYPNFLETVTQIIPMYMFRALGGLLFLIGFIIMMWNLYKTMGIGNFINDEESQAPALENKASRSESGETIHRFLERKPTKFVIFAFIALAIGGAVEIIPMIFIKSNIPTIESVKPYTPLELAGRDIYIREGCYTCHSQMVRPFRWETDRYGEYSKIGEFVYDHPFQWGSKRTGPDLARAGVVGGPMYKNAAWHYKHFMNPQEMNEQSIMPKYLWFAENDIDLDIIPAKIRVMQILGVPYPEGFDEVAVENLKSQAQLIVDDLKKSGIEIEPTKQMIAMIAYMHKLGKDISSDAAIEEAIPVENAEETPTEVVDVELSESAEDIAAGKELFTTRCAVCHGT